MKYCSTRGGFSGLTFEDALFSGFSSDGGILLPETIPSLDQATLRQWATLSYPQLLKQIIPLFISEDEIPRKDVNSIIDRAFSRFSIPEVIRVKKLSKNLNIAELFHGPTLAFKDLALSCVGQFVEYFLEKRKKHVTILVGTSGDTGSAAIESVRGLRWADIVVLLPRGMCSRIQELQMTTVLDDNVHIYRVDGSSDDLDHPIKKVFMDAEFVKQHNIISINSINWARILVQIAHYFYVAFQVSGDSLEEVEIAVPTGACGNVTSGVIAHLMGLPIKLVCTVNVNDIVARTMSQGDFSLSDKLQKTFASAMDIQVPYNMERLIYLFSGGDSRLVSSLMTEMEAKGKVQIPPLVHNKMKALISSHKVTDEEILKTMRKCWETDEYLLCPHTAVAACYHYQKYDSDNGLKRICIATASPAKFEETVEAAGLMPQPTQEILALDGKQTQYCDMEKGQDWEAMLREKIEAITSKAI